MLFAQGLRIREELRTIRRGPLAVPATQRSSAASQAKKTGRRFPSTTMSKSSTNPSPFAHSIPTFHNQLLSRKENISTVLKGRRRLNFQWQWEIMPEPSEGRTNRNPSLRPKRSRRTDGNVFPFNHPLPKLCLL